MEILEAYDLTDSYRAAAELAGCDHHTVARYVQLRESGQSPVEREHRSRPIDEYLDKIEELVASSGSRMRADVVHRRISAMGFTGGERTTRRAVAQVKARLRAGRRRVFRPWMGSIGRRGKQAWSGAHSWRSAARGPPRCYTRVSGTVGAFRAR